MARIVGNVVGLPNPQSDWEQKDDTKADYIKNKPKYGNEYSNGLKGNAAAANALRIDDISPTQNTIALNVSRVNLLASPFGTINVEEGKNYTLSVGVKEGIELPEYYTYSLAWYNSDGQWNNAELLSSSNELNGGTYTFAAGEEGNYNYYIDYVGLTEDMFEYAQLEEGIVATTPVSYIEDLDNVSFYKYGKNLLDMTKIYPRDKAGESIEVIDKDTIRWTGSYWIFLPVHIPAGATFRISMGSYEVESGTCKGFSKWYMKYTDGTMSEGFQNVYTATAEKNVEHICVYKNPAAGAATIVIKDYQIEIGEAKTDYERYKEPVKIVDINNIPASENMSIISDTAGVNIKATYNKDLNKVIADLTAAIVSLGGNV